MPVEPPANLVNQLVRLELAAPHEVARVASRAGRIVELAQFDSVWLDALVQAQVLTPYQAAEITAGRGESLRHGPYAVTRPVARAHYAECYAARHVASRRAVELYVVRRPQAPTAAMVAGLAKLVADSADICGSGNSMAEDFGTSATLVWAACAAAEGVSAADWIVENGRFPAAAVLQVAREMARQLAAWEQAGIVHGDLCAAGLLLDAAGHVALAAPGLRGIVRPHEGYSFGDLRPEAYDYLAPERISDGTPPTTASDVYACGCLWWQLLTGRAPFPGGNSLEKLKAVHAARVVDVRQLAPEVPDDLAGVVQSCLAREIESRPASFAEVAARLGAPTRAGSSSLAALVWRPEHAWHAVRRRARGRKPPRQGMQWAAGIATVVVLVALAIVPLWMARRAAQPTKIASAPSQPAPLAANPTEEIASVAAPQSPRSDPAVQPAAAVLPAVEPSADDIVLPAGEMLRVEQLDLAPHAHVRGPRGRRVLVSVPRRGLIVACEDVTFEGIDFVCDADRSAGRAVDTRGGAMIVVEAQTVTLVGCSFSGEGDAPAAILWRGAAESVPGLGGEIVLRDCALAGSAAAVDCQGSGPLAISLANSLCVDVGPIVRLHRAPRADEPLHVSLERVTTRGRSFVLECRYGRLGDDVGPIKITANTSALAGTGTALVMLSGAARPEALVGAFVWSGEGSIVTPRAAMLAWLGATRKRQTWPEEELDIAGLVRSELEFAGSAEGEPAASRVVRWQVPLRSPDPPGADPGTLARPRKPHKQ